MKDVLRTFEPGPPDRRPPALTSPRGELPLRAVAVRAHVVGATADVEVEQTFENVFDEVLEVGYVFPLPDLAAVTRCELRVGGRVVAARLEERGAAREAYAQAIEAGQRAALAEQERPGVFTITLGNLAPGERATVRLGMAYLLPREDGRHVLRLPLVVGERYVPVPPPTRWRSPTRRGSRRRGSPPAPTAPSSRSRSRSCTARSASTSSRAACTRSASARTAIARSCASPPASAWIATSSCGSASAATRSARSS